VILYKRNARNQWVEFEERPKFLACGTGKKDMTYFTQPFPQMVQSNLLMIHEKYTSAVHFTEATGYPSLALSGCANWSSAGTLSPTVRQVVERMPFEAQVCILFDGDIAYSPRVYDAASKLKGWILELRPDLTVKVIPQPPMDLPLNGFDDWCTLQLRKGSPLAVECMLLLESEGLDVTSRLPGGYLVQKYGLASKEDRDGNDVILHTADNYFKLFQHEKWEPYVRNTDKTIYDTTDFSRKLSLKDLTFSFQAWLESGVFTVGATAEGVYKTKVADAINKTLSLPKRNVSIPLLILEGFEPVTEEEARAAAYRLSFEAMGITGPMTAEETVETWLRIATDTCALWSTDEGVQVDWVLALVGPSGSGKSKFPHNFFKCIADAGMRLSVAQIDKTGGRSNHTEILRQMRDSMVVVLDEYNPDESNARSLEQMILTLSTTRQDKFRNAYEEDSSEQVRHAALMLTTTDKNRTYIKSAENTGERRFITMEVSHTTTYCGVPCMNFKLISECGRTLLRYGYQQHIAKQYKETTEFSRKYVYQYINQLVGGSNVVRTLADIVNMMGGAEQLKAMFERFHEEYYREATEDVRFSSMQFETLIAPGLKLTHREHDWVRSFILHAGAKPIGKARCGKGNVLKDNAYSVKDWQALVDRVLALG
jgi:KaiC/GvpD/RAD55 family RecA-like ATPase